MKPAEIGALVAAAAVLGVAFYVWKRGGVANVAADLGTGAVRAVSGAAGGVVSGIGDAIGIPRTDQTECERAIAEGRTWDASFACPAGQFIGSIFSSGSSSQQAADPYPNETARLARYANPGNEYDVYDHYTDPMGNGF